MKRKKKEYKSHLIPLELVDFLAKRRKFEFNGCEFAYIRGRAVAFFSSTLLAVLKTIVLSLSRLFHPGDYCGEEKKDDRMEKYD